ncbi:MAG TPA: hypothetical protein VMV69_24870 [Pirellulales bacterium]|nr:hypothetical protein [Pirellulales bacterium]
MRITLGFGSPLGRRRWRRGLAGGLLAVVLLVAAAPYLLSWTPLANLALSGASWRIQGRATVGAASLGWFSQPALTDLEVRTRDGQPLVRAPNVALDRPLWQIVTRRDVGQVRLDRPELHLLFRQNGSNLEDLLGRRLKPQEPTGEATAPREGRPPADIQRGVDVRLVDLRVAWRTPASRQEWNVEGINLAFGLRPAWATAGGSPELVVERGVVVDHCRISKGMCDDFLDLAAPILSKATDVEGAFSIDLDDGRVPLDRPETGQLAGRLSLHRVAVGAGSFVDQLAEKLHVPPVVELARESVVTFELLDGRVHHRDLEFSLPPLRVRTHGSVGFDESLDMLAEIRVVLPEGITSALPTARALTEKTLLIPIIGTLSKPRIDVSAMGDTDLARVVDTLQQFGVYLARRKHPPAAGAGGAAEAPEPSDALFPPQAVDLLEDLAQKWSKRREKNKTNQPAGEPEKPAADDTRDSAEKRTLERVLDRMRKLKK